MKKTIVLLMIATCFIIAALSGCGDDNGTNPVPSDLIGTWAWISATMDDVSMGTLEEVTEITGADSLSYTYNANRSWSGAVYDASMNPLTTASGTFSVKGDTLIMVISEEDGIAVEPPDADSILFTVTATTLVQYTVEAGHTFAVNFIKE